MTNQTGQLNARDLHVLLATIAAGSLINAAQQLRTSQSAISRSIANVEHALGVSLLEQTPGGIEPTSHGRALIAIHDVNRRSRRTDRDATARSTRGDGVQPSPGRREVIQMAATITLTYPFSAEDTELLNKLLGNTPGGTASASAAKDYFPADQALAPFPSPENSQQMILSGKVSGRPYLKDTLGRIHTLRINAAGVADYWINGVSLAPGWSSHADSPPTQLLVRQGGVYVFLASGVTQQVNASGGIYNASVPPAYASGGGTTQLPPLPAMPVPSAVAPGSGRKVLVGATRPVRTLTAAIESALPGDRITLDQGVYTDAPGAIKVPVLIDLGGSSFDLTGKTAGLARGKGFLVPAADCIIENGVITGVAMDQGSGQLTSAIRPDAGCGYLTINKMTLTNNQCGVGHGGFPIVIAISDSNLSGNGLKANSGALTHNLYVGKECRRLTLTNVVSNGTNEAHAIKYRGPELIVNGGTFASAPGKPFDIPNGSTVPFKITGATILKGPGDPDHGILACGEEGADNGLAGGTISGGSIQAHCVNPAILGPGGTITVSGVALSGNKINASGGVVLVGV
jgi:hypothetical protein